MSDFRRAYTEPFRVREVMEEGDPHEQADFLLSMRIWMHLQEHYPGHPWHVEVESRPEVGMASIYLQGFSTWGYHIRLRDLASDPGFRHVTRGGGEILERFNLPRSGLDFASFLAAQKTSLTRYNRPPPGM